MARPTEESRYQKASETRSKLITAAVAEFATQGFSVANINRISESAGFAKGTIYNYFPSKKDLLSAILEEVGNEHVTFLIDRIHQGLSPESKLILFYTSGFLFIEQNALKSRLLLTTLQTGDSSVQVQLERIYHPLFQMLREEVLVPGISQGRFRPLDPDLTVRHLMTFYLGTGSQMAPSGKPYLTAEGVADFALHALLAPSEPQP